MSLAVDISEHLPSPEIAMPCRAALFLIPKSRKGTVKFNQFLTLLPCRSQVAMLRAIFPSKDLSLLKQIHNVLTFAHFSLKVMQPTPLYLRRFDYLQSNACRLEALD